jgi:hypothetical protein
MEIRTRSKVARAALAAVTVLMVLCPAAYAHKDHPNNGNGHGHGNEGDHQDMPTILAFGTMYGVDGGFVGGANPIRGTVGDEAPWKLTSAQGFLGANGHLRIRVRGLIFGDGTPNDEPTFRARVSCVTEDESGGTPNADVTTGFFPANAAGDSDIDAQLTLPNPCVAPIVFILAGSEDKWFAVTGFEAAEGD